LNPRRIADGKRYPIFAIMSMTEDEDLRAELRAIYYTLNGIGYKIQIGVYKQVKAYFANKGYYDRPGSYQDYLYDSLQRRYLDELIFQIMQGADSIDDMARIAINIVQRIPYDDIKVRYDLRYDPECPIRFPYEVIYDNKGICSEKSLLLAFLLKELGLGVALFRFDEENHMTVGIKCPPEYGYRHTEYAFVETTGVNLVTDDQIYYVNSKQYGFPFIQLKSIPELIPICDGASFEGVYQEWFDTRDLHSYQKNSASYYHIARYIEISRKYGL
jgi:hypothetical protein